MSDCELCGGWGWITIADDDGSDYQIECPQECETEADLVIGEVPF